MKREKYELSLSCAFCPASDKILVDIGSWRTKYNGTDEEVAFCPDHLKAAEWLDDVCPGCVSGWGDCKLHSAIYHPTYGGLKEEDLEVIKAGRCPRRCGGTFIQGPSTDGRLESVDISDVAPTEAGQAMVEGIITYWSRWHANLLPRLGDHLTPAQATDAQRTEAMGRVEKAMADFAIQHEKDPDTIFVPKRWVGDVIDLLKGHGLKVCELHPKSYTVAIREGVSSVCISHNRHLEPVEFNLEEE